MRLEFRAEHESVSLRVLLSARQSRQIIDLDAVEIICLFRVITSRPNQTRGNGLRLRLGSKLDAPFHPARVLCIELRLRSFLDLFQETKRGYRRERLRSRPVE